MKTHFVTFFTESKFGQQNYYLESVRRLIESAKKWDVEDFNIFTPENLKVTPEVREWMKKTSEPGYGFYSWKPLIILETFKNLNFGDVVLYHDAGRKEYNFEFRTDFNPLIKKVIEKHNGIGIAQGPFLHRQWCKEDCFVNMGCTDTRYYELYQLSATWGIWEKSELTIEILEKWLLHCFHPYGTVTTDDRTYTLSKFDDFQQHRWDQAILTNLLFKYKFERDLFTPLFGKSDWEKDINNFTDINL
jgi:hypothetical protein